MFPFKYFFSTTDNVSDLDLESKNAITLVRSSREPVFLHIKTNRLKAHSKGDDTRDNLKIKELEAVDPINKFAINNVEINVLIILSYLQLPLIPIMLQNVPHTQTDTRIKCS